jgi:hypothetical protein
MKTQKLVILLFSFVLIFVFTSGCRVIQPKHRSKTVIIQTNPNGKIPPGQLKKVTGEKSAKKYAPGQNKKPKKKK